MSNGEKVRMRLFPYCEMTAEYLLGRLQSAARRGVDLSKSRSHRSLLALELSFFYYRGREQEGESWRGADEEPNPILRRKVLLTDLEQFKRYRAEKPSWPIVDDEPLTDRQRDALYLLYFKPTSALQFAYDSWGAQRDEGPTDGQVSAAVRALNRLADLGLAERLETEGGAEWRITEAGTRALKGEDYMGEL